MASPTFPDVPQFNNRKEIHMGSTPMKDLLYSNDSREDLFQAYDKENSSAALRSSSTRNLETLPELSNFRRLDGSDYHRLVVTMHPEKTLASTSLSKETSGKNISAFNGKPFIKKVCSDGNLFPKETGSADIIRVSSSQENESIGRKENHMGSTPMKDLLYSNDSREDLSQAYDKENSSAALKSSSTRNVETLPELSNFRQLDGNDYHRLAVTMHPEKTLASTSLSKEASGKNASVFNGKPFIKKACSYGNPLPKEAGSSHIIRLSSQENESICRKENHMGSTPMKDLLYSNDSREDLSQAYDKENSSAALKSSLTRNLETLPELSNFRQLDGNDYHRLAVTMHPEKTLDSTSLSKEASGKNASVFNGKPFIKKVCSDGNTLSKETGSIDVYRVSSSQENESISKIQLPLNVCKFLEAEKAKVYVTDCKLNDDIDVSKAKEASPVESVNINKPCDDDVIFCPSASRSSRLYPLREIYSKPNKPLKESLVDLEDWAKRGLDNVFNRPEEFSSEATATNLKKDLKHGLAIMKEMTVRLYTLMRAANLLRDIDPKLIPGYEKILGDFIKKLRVIWNMKDGIEEKVYDEYKSKLKVFVTYPGTSTVDTRQRAKPKILITNAYTVVIERLPLLQQQMGDLRETIRIICSEIEKLL